MEIVGEAAPEDTGTTISFMPDAEIFEQIIGFAAGTPINVVNPDVLSARRGGAARPS